MLTRRHIWLKKSFSLHGLCKKYFSALRVNPLTAKLFNLIFHSLEVVSRWRDPQLQVSENYSDLTKWRSTVIKYCGMLSHIIFNICKVVLNVLIKNTLVYASPAVKGLRPGSMIDMSTFLQFDISTLKFVPSRYDWWSVIYNTRRWPNDGLNLNQRRRLWFTINIT